MSEFEIVIAEQPVGKERFRAWWHVFCVTADNPFVELVNDKLGPIALFYGPKSMLSNLHFGTDAGTAENRQWLFFATWVKSLAKNDLGSERSSS